MRNLGPTLFTVICLGIGGTGCTSTHDQLELTSGATNDRHPYLTPVDATPMEKGQVHYRDGSYGLAEKHFRVAVERDPSNAEAWLGLAASYDQLRRFDHAARAYRSVIKLVGHTPTVLNNLGYHYYLKGNSRSAIQTLERAQQADPGNQYIVNNLETVRGSASSSENDES